MRKITALAGILLLLSMSAFATNARVESMGKSSTFFMDDVSIYDNPANINIYPNFLIGEAGHMVEFSDTSTVFRNQDPAEPYGGGILSFSLNKDKNAETRYPMVCIGAMMNHKNEMVDVLKSAAVANHHIIPTPQVPNSDFFIGYTAANGTMVGGHFYADVQDITVPGANLYGSRGDLKKQGVTTGIDSLDSVSFKPFYSGDAEWTSEVFRGDVGVNMPLTQNMDLEVSGGLGLLQYSGPTNALGAFNIDSYSANDISYFLNARLFSTLLSLNGEIVPVFKLKQINVRKYEVLEWSTGLGANVTLDRGFFWAGAEFTRNSTDQPQGASTGQIKNTTTVHIPLSFGIERNVVWEWLVLRVGFRKIIWGTSSNENDFAMLETNAENDMTISDHVGGGIGINIEEKLKIDAVMAEDFLYKWGNLISGNEHHVFTRITATYSF